MKTSQFAPEAAEAFRKFVLQPDFPCLGAKAAFNSDSQTIRVFEELGSPESTAELVDALYNFTRLVGQDSVEPNRGATSHPGGSTESRPTMRVKS